MENIEYQCPVCKELTGKRFSIMAKCFKEWATYFEAEIGIYICVKCGCLFEPIEDNSQTF